jgi:RNA polymerase sigma-B factor
MSLSAQAPRYAGSRAAREQTIEENLPLVETLARRFARRGERFDDLVQVGAIGLINAVDRFDAGRGTELRAYAIPTILGEMRRHLRDHATTIRVPRREQNARASLLRARRELAARLDHAPSWAELVASAELSADELARGVEAEQATTPVSLARLETGDGPAVDDEGYASGEDRALVSEAFGNLDTRERRALGLSFFADLSQREVAAHLGVSQSHASRLIRSALAKMRAAVGADDVCNPQDKGLHS